MAHRPVAKWKYRVSESSLLQNSLNCDRKYLDKKISYVEITGQMVPDRPVDRAEGDTDGSTVECELSRFKCQIIFL